MGVNGPPVPVTAPGAALIKVCAYAGSVIPIAIVDVLYPDPYDQLNELRAPVVAIPTVLIPPEPLICTVTAAPTRGAIPNPPVDPTETTTPPLGRLFWFTSEVLITWAPLTAELTPVKVMLDIPEFSMKE